MICLINLHKVNLLLPAILICLFLATVYLVMCFDASTIITSQTKNFTNNYYSYFIQFREFYTNLLLYNIIINIIMYTVAVLLLCIIMAFM